MRFAKWHGLGNDYLVIERADAGRPLDAELVRRLCDVHLGVGADGIVEVVDAEGARCEIVIWNPDGSTAELSGNGTRIAARWLARRAGAAEVVVAVGAREVAARSLGGLEVEQQLGTAEVSAPERLDVAGEQLEVTAVTVGNPHAVIRREPDRATLLRLGPLVETHARFPGRTNVQLVRVDGRSELTVAVWERGAGETPASGTSACAAAAAAVANGWCESPVLVHMRGGDLHVAIEDGWQAILTGPAQEICTGEISRELLRELRWETPSCASY